MSQSAFVELKVPPGVVKTRSGEGAAGRWSDTQNVRFKAGKPQKRAGFVRLNTALLVGIARGMDAWNTTKGFPRYAVGTHLKLYGSVDGIEPIDITPLRFSQTFKDKLSTLTGYGAIVLSAPAPDSDTLANNPLTTTNGVPVVTVAHVAHGHQTGDKVFLFGAVAVAGITLAGLYTITKTSDDAYTVVGSANASSATTGGGAGVLASFPIYDVGHRFRFYGNSHIGGSQVGGVVLEPEYEVVKVLSGSTFALYPATNKGTLASDPFTTESGKPAVKVTHVAHGRKTGDAVWFNGAAAVAGLTPDGEYPISKVDDDHYNIVMGVNASSTATGGGSAVGYHYAEAAQTTVTNGGGEVSYLEYLSDPFTAVEGSSTITVEAKGHGATANDLITISGAEEVGGLNLNGSYRVRSVEDADTYTFDAPELAAASENAGGSNVLVEYEIPIGSIDRLLPNRGYGRGAYGRGAYGRPDPTIDPVYYEPRFWAIGNIGEDAFAAPLGGPIYYWDMSKGGRATLIPNSPTMLRFACMTEERHLHALGVNGDPLVFGWADQEDINLWTPAETNTANNSRRVTQGSVLVAMAPIANGVNLIWTDTAVYIHQYTGGPFIYDTRLDARNAGLSGPQAFAVTSLGAFWFGAAGFKMWSGSTQPIPNAPDIEDWVKTGLNIDQNVKCFCSYDAVNESIDWYFVRKGTGEPDLLITLNLQDFSWSNSIELRTTGATFNAGAQLPHRVGWDGKIYTHEVGVDADGVAAPSSLTLAPLELAKGKWVEMLGFDPDMKRQVGDVELTIESYDRNPANPVETETVTVSPDEEMADLRSAGRHIGLKLSQNVLGGDWALDTPQVDTKAAGGRR